MIEGLSHIKKKCTNSNMYLTRQIMKYIVYMCMGVRKACSLVARARGLELKIVSSNPEACT